MSTVTVTPTVLSQPVLGSRRFSNFFWAIVVSIGGVGFLLAGLSSYFKVNLLPVSNPLTMAFIPQGIALTFYGVAGTLLATYLWAAIALDIGGGYNKFDREAGDITIFRNGFPGKNRLEGAPVLDFEYVFSGMVMPRVNGLFTYCAI